MDDKQKWSFVPRRFGDTMSFFKLSQKLFSYF